jgi:hypothetical protein
MIPALHYLPKNTRVMYRLTAFLFTLIIALFVLNTAYAGAKKPGAKKLPAQERVDTSKIQAKKFDANAINKFRADKDFNYSENLDGGQPSLWSRFWLWVWNKLFGWLKYTKYGGTVLEYVLIGLSIALLIYVISQSVGIDPIRLWRGEAKKIDVPYSESLENIHEINFDSEIEKAIAQNNYRLAVRLLYLKCLKQLSDTRLIQWQIDKTNSAYIHELTDPKQQQTFKLITHQFEYVWYGNFAIDKQAFSNIDVLFQNFKKQLP